MNDPRYGYPHPPQGVYQGPPPVMAPPQDYAPPPPQRQVGFLEGCLAALCCCCDPAVAFCHLMMPVIIRLEEFLCVLY
ncbi:hypothetical protein POTOM_005773 [Populus tomentosa]|uniref:Cysteine-rich transmembrane domain-containing protein n=1 Tax=Populus tomentosa TaxID=118781 RepID=A0A8X8AX27_POPTO|nr:hypothetical protein POTOM_005773 [Populus tomentosa]